MQRRVFDSDFEKSDKWIPEYNLWIDDLHSEAHEDRFIHKNPENSSKSEETGESIS